jgi:2,3-bisphosphoglycerate-dependent phosphoglycerate mutase
MIRETRVWLARHAETTTPTVFHGAESDIGLSELGERQAVAAAEWFQTLQPTCLISSNMLRARLTAAPIAQRTGLPHLIESRFHERRIGDMSGQPFSTTDGFWAITVREWSSGNTAYTTPDAESFDDLRERLITAWNDTMAAHAGERIVLIAHGIVCKILLLCLLNDFGPKRWEELGRVPNLAVSELFGNCETGWHSTQILQVPPPVLSLKL